MIYCQQCLHELPDGTLFCDICGTSVLPDAKRGSLTPYGPSDIPSMPPTPPTPPTPPAPRKSAPRRGVAAQPRDLPRFTEAAELTPATPPQIMPPPFKANAAGRAVSFADV